MQTFQEAQIQAAADAIKENWGQPYYNMAKAALEAAGTIAVPLTKDELTAVLRAAFPTVRPQDMGDHITLVLDEVDKAGD